jgi:hypothetical protein
MGMRRLGGLMLVALLGLAAPSAETSGSVQLERVPGNGLQPQAVADSTGLIHVVYFKGPAAGGDLFYVRRTADGRYSTPLRVNSQPGSAIATGTVRGAQIALGRGNRVHVIWNGSKTATPEVKGGRPMLYSRLSIAGDGFEPQRNLLTWSGAIDGGGTLAADNAGRVFVAWHANPAHGDDARRAVYLAESRDDGNQFARERRISPEALGACGCCSMRALIDRAGSLFVVFRAAGNNVNRDMTLLSSRDGGATFAATRLQPWKLEACPMSTEALAEGPNAVTAAWDTAGQIYFTNVVRGPDGRASIEAAPGASGRRKHPVLAYNGRGEALLAWLEGTAWARGGSLAWQVYDASGKPSAERGTAKGVPVWGLAAAAPREDGRFLLLY